MTYKIYIYNKLKTKFYCLIFLFFFNYFFKKFYSKLYKIYDILRLKYILINMIYIYICYIIQYRNKDQYIFTAKLI